jgi:hypothetical protein
MLPLFFAELPVHPTAHPLSLILPLLHFVAHIRTSSQLGRLICLPRNWAAFYTSLCGCFFARRPPRCSSTLQYQGSHRSFPRLWICSGHTLFPS